MKKNVEKKINWKNVAIIGGIFTIGVVTGAVGNKALIRKMIECEPVMLDAKKCKLWGKDGIEFVMRCSKAGIEIPLQTTIALTKDHAEGLLGMIDGKITFEQLGAE